MKGWKVGGLWAGLILGLLAIIYLILRLMVVPKIKVGVDVTQIDKLIPVKIEDVLSGRVVRYEAR